MRVTADRRGVLTTGVRFRGLQSWPLRYTDLLIHSPAAALRVPRAEMESFKGSRQHWPSRGLSPSLSPPVQPVARRVDSIP